MIEDKIVHYMKVFKIFDEISHLSDVINSKQVDEIKEDLQLIDPADYYENISVILSKYEVKPIDYYNFGFKCVKQTNIDRFSLEMQHSRSNRFYNALVTPLPKLILYLSQGQNNHLFRQLYPVFLSKTIDVDYNYPIFFKEEIPAPLIYDSACENNLSAFSFLMGCGADLKQVESQSGETFAQILLKQHSVSTEIKKIIFSYLEKDLLNQKIDKSKDSSLCKL